MVNDDDFELLDEVEEEVMEVDDTLPEEMALTDEAKKRRNGRDRFAKVLNENIKNMKDYVMNPGGGVTIAVLNYKFAYALTDVFCETLTQLLADGYCVIFDQFGRYEVKTQPPKRVKTIFTNNKEIILPELKMIRFYPSPILKARIRGELTGRIKRDAGFMKNIVRKGEKNIIEGEESESGN